jgi:hypothetical protein
VLDPSPGPGKLAGGVELFITSVVVVTNIVEEFEESIAKLFIKIALV